MRIKFKPTGNIFDLPEEEAKRIVIEDKGFNYEVLDGEIKIDDETPEETTVYNQIVENETENDNAEEKTEETEEDDKPKALEDYTIPELKSRLDELKIPYSKSAKKADLIALFSNDTEEKTEETEE